MPHFNALLEEVDTLKAAASRSTCVPDDGEVLEQHRQENKELRDHYDKVKTELEAVHKELGEQREHCAELKLKVEQLEGALAGAHDGAKARENERAEEHMAHAKELSAKAAAAEQECAKLRTQVSMVPHHRHVLD